MATVTRAATAAEMFLAYRPDLGSRFRLPHLPRSRFADDALKFLLDPRRSKARATIQDEFQHVGFEPPSAQRQYHAMIVFADKSVATVFDNRVELAATVDDTIYFRRRDDSRTYAGVWNGKRVEDLHCQIARIGERIGWTHAEQLAKLATALQIPHVDREANAQHPYSPLGSVLAIDKKNDVLLNHQGILHMLPGNERALRAALTENDQQMHALGALVSNSGGTLPDEYLVRRSLLTQLVDIHRDLRVAQARRTLEGAPGEASVNSGNGLDH